MHSTQVKKDAIKESILALKPKADMTGSPKQGYQGPHKKGSCPPKLKIKSQDTIAFFVY